jgi:hypothetical protein
MVMAQGRVRALEQQDTTSRLPITQNNFKCLGNLARGLGSGWQESPADKLGSLCDEHPRKMTADQAANPTSDGPSDVAIN